MAILIHLDPGNACPCPCLGAVQVRAICWSSNDTRVVSAGADGAVYEWRLSDLRREKENVLKGCQYRCAATPTLC